MKIVVFLHEGQLLTLSPIKEKIETMFSNELKLFQRSSVFQTESIWTDPYISQSLLKAHLDEPTNPSALS
jgi:hypothetical protein